MRTGLKKLFSLVLFLATVGSCLVIDCTRVEAESTGGVIGAPSTPPKPTPPNVPCVFRGEALVQQCAKILEEVERLNMLVSASGTNPTEEDKAKYEELLMSFEVKQCLVEGCTTIPATPTPTPIPTPTPRPTPTPPPPTINPIPIEPAQSCPYYTIDYHALASNLHELTSGYVNDIYRFESGNSLNYVFKLYVAPELTCVRRWVAEANAICEAELRVANDRGDYPLSAQDARDYFMNCFFREFAKPSRARSIDFIDASCDGGKRPPKGCTALHSVRDFTPISLIWNEEAAGVDEATIVEFPLDLRNPGASYVWKASANKPLLVLDPARTGKIVDASQLFGNWTFGGKRYASLRTTEEPRLWENGYEALASLDMNSDGVVSGEEARDLALWFDENQNGVSEKGEVRPLCEVGVTKIFVAYDRVDAETGDIHASVGYEREVDGELRIAPSVDWTSESASSILELKLRGKVDELSRSAGRDRALVSTEDRLLARKLRRGPSITGLWKYSTEKQGELVAEGLLFFLEAEDGTIVGRSVGESRFVYKDMSAPEIDGVIATLNIHGERTGVVDGQMVYSFLTNLDDSGHRIENTAMLHKGAKSISGTSSVRMSYEGHVLRESYQWKAERIDLPY